MCKILYHTRIITILAGAEPTLVSNRLCQILNCYSKTSLKDRLMLPVFTVLLAACECILVANSSKTMTETALFRSVAVINSSMFEML